MISLEQFKNIKQLNILVLDLETTSFNQGPTSVGDWGSSVYCEENYIVTTGFKYNQGPVIVRFNQDDPTRSWNLSKVDIVVGHALKFDLGYLRRFYPEWQEWLCHGLIWDTQIVEYLLSGQDHIYPTLNDLALKYGGYLKPDKIKDYWEAGIGCEKIPRDDLEEYQKGDVENTSIIFQRQLPLVDAKEMFPLIYSNMRTEMGLLEMESNGVRFDVPKAFELSKPLRIEFEALHDKIRTFMSSFFIKEIHSDININSGDLLSLTFFGGEYKYTVSEPVIDPVTNQYYKFKTGKRKNEVKFHKVEKTAFTKGLECIPKPSWAVKKAGFYQTNKDVLKELAYIYKNNKDVLYFVNLLQEYQNLKTDLATFYDGYTAYTWPDGCIHHNLNQCRTGTGRLSSTKPNLQNISGDKD